MRELINCIAATAAWIEFCTANRLVDCPELRKAAQIQAVIQGDNYVVSRSMAFMLELRVLEQARREQPRIIPFNGRA